MKFLALLFFALGTHWAFSQYSNEIIQTSIYSEILKEDRKLLIYSSDQEHQTVNGYPTIYLLDGGVNFYLTIGIVSNLVRAELIPHVNVIGINNYDYDREYDFSTPNISDPNINFETGGFENFKEFIETELFQYAKDSISNSQNRIIIGHSLGGFFGLKLLMEHPESFSSAILVDPSVWWNDSEIFSAMDIPKIGFENVDFYFSRSGSDSTNIVLFNTLNDKMTKGSFSKFPNENHISVLTPSIFDGLKHVFKHYPRLEVLYETPSFELISTKIEELNKQYGTTILPKVRVLAPLARSFTNQNKFSESIKILSYLKVYHPNDIMVLNFLGEAYQKSGDTKNALLIYHQSMEIAKSKQSPMIKWIETRIAELEK
jgi:uncharacterized protein